MNDLIDRITLSVVSYRQFCQSGSTDDGGGVRIVKNLPHWYENPILISNQI